MLPRWRVNVRPSQTTPRQIQVSGSITTTVTVSGAWHKPVHTAATKQAYCEILGYIAVSIRKEEIDDCPVCLLWLSEGRSALELGNIPPVNYSMRYISIFSVQHEHSLYDFPVTPLESKLYMPFIRNARSRYIAQLGQPNLLIIHCNLIKV